MALNPLIALQSRPVDIGGTFNTLLNNIGKFDAIRQDREQAPIRNEILQAQLESQQAQVPIREQQLQAGQEAAFQERQKNRLTSVARFAQSVLPALNRDDPETALQIALQHRARLGKEIQANPGIQLDTAETDQFIEALQSGDPEQQLEVTRLADSAVQMAQQSGLLVDKNLTPRQRELKQFSDLPTNTPQEVEFKKQFGTAIGAIAKTPTLEQKLELTKKKGDIQTQQAIEKTKGVTREKFREQTLATPELERVKFLSKNMVSFESDISESKNVLEEIDRAIEIWETAPGTISGPFASRAPALLDDTQELESILAGLGIDRLSSFKGATSERELATAFRAGASIEQDAKAGIRRLMKQRRDITRNNDRLGGLLRESKALLRKQPQQSQPAPEVDLSDPNISIEDLEAELARLENE